MATTRNYEIVDFKTKKVISTFSWDEGMWPDRLILIDGKIYGIRNFVYDPAGNKVIVWVDKQERYDA